MQNVIRKHDNGTVKRKNEELFIHHTPKIIRKRPNNRQKTKASTKNTSRNAETKKSTSFGSKSNRSTKFIHELKTLLSTSLNKSQQNYYAKNEYRNNDFDRVYLTNLIDSVSYPKFVHIDVNEHCSNNRYGKEDNRNKSEPLENKQDWLSWWAENKGMDFVIKCRLLRYRDYPKDQ